MRLFVPVVVLAASLVTGCSQIPVLSLIFGQSVSGRWVVMRDQSSKSFSMTLLDSNGQITGSAEGIDLSGSRNGNRVELMVKLSSGGVIYAGEVSSSGRMITGTVGGSRDDTFTAVKSSD